MFMVFLLGLIVSSVTAAEYGTCKTCFDGYTGAQCTQALCYGETTCFNGGTCSSPNNCTCPENYIGSKCEQALCYGSVTCENGGTCTSPDECSCTEGFTGQRCETEVSGHTSSSGSSIPNSHMVIVMLIVKIFHMAHNFFV
ncbi:wnt inhibitory factor 1-like isoform X2 [Ruditapes philippinarum]|uniref:wnt inhibitory factor 1-like isoform X2 n=1 Tax=Ruditapes philippinarum TaxID=129788 RepID=UPI00295BDB93|nr:wnt inhibitory factor 1-like isoform X2 [Ruditapes philippinarum]